MSSWTPFATRGGQVSGVRVATGRNEIRTVGESLVVFAEVECFGPYCGPVTGLRRTDWINGGSLYRQATRQCRACASSRRPITEEHIEAAEEAAERWKSNPTTLRNVSGEVTA